MDTLNELSMARQGIIRKEAEIESIFDRLEAMQNGKLYGTGNDTVDPDDLHRTRTKLRHEKERLVELKCKATQLEIDAVRLGGLTHV